MPPHLQPSEDMHEQTSSYRRKHFVPDCSKTELFEEPDTHVGSPQPKQKTILRIVLRALATVILVGLLARNLNWQGLVDSLEHVEWSWWLGGLVVANVSQVLSGIRWAGLARPLGFHFSIPSYIGRYYEGMFFSLCLPTSIGGDVVKAYRLANSTHGRMVAGCTVIADRLAGLSALGVLVGTSFTSDTFNLSIWPTLLVGASLSGLLVLITSLSVVMLKGVVGFIPAHSSVGHFIAKLLPYQKRPILIIRAIGWSLLVQLSGAICVWLIACGLHIDIPPFKWFLIVPLVALLTVLPLSISGVGIREGGLALLLNPEGISTEQSVALGLLWFLTTVIGGLIGGFIFFLNRSHTHSPNNSDPVTHLPKNI
ncbi:MAG: UPF0104 family protein [Planctomycetota bacterium]|nr:MAG: UPF0104 family protein [Planctomycetota bacterium]